MTEEDIVRITWHGHACFEIENVHILVTDPHDGKSIGISPPAAVADLVLVSHDHFDHNKVSSVSDDSTKLINTAGPFEFGAVRGKGIQVFHDDQHAGVGDVITELLEGRLLEIRNDQVCGGGGH